MYILDEISNRTENWRTARSFAHLLIDSHDRAELARRLGEDPGTSRGDIEVQLFWTGMRDYIHGKPAKKRATAFECAVAFNRLFPSLRSKIEEFNKLPPRNRLRLMQDGNYDLTMQPGEKGLYENLTNTEIDIVLESPGKLFIGEAKYESDFRGKGDLVLVHQLIRQYVTASILLDIMGSDKKVVPFLVVDKNKRESVMKAGQVRFMIDQMGWLKDQNVLTWDFIKRLHP